MLPDAELGAVLAEAAGWLEGEGASALVPRLAELAAFTGSLPPRARAERLVAEANLIRDGEWLDPAAEAVTTSCTVVPGIQLELIWTPSSSSTPPPPCSTSRRWSMTTRPIDWARRSRG